jgi:hypothetical protein
MIKLNEHIVEIEGKQYIPADIAVQAVLEAIGARNDLQNAFNEIINSVENAKKND